MGYVARAKWKGESGVKLPDPVIRGRIEAGKFVWTTHATASWKRAAKALDGQEVEITIRPRRLGVTMDQHAYYRGVILGPFAEKAGYQNAHEAHEALKAGFLGLDPRGPIPSMASFDKRQASDFLEYALRQAAEIGVPIEDPWRPI